ncbi:hypothetical protein B0H14DRAFT_2590134 [Mycena olivaceomarginata]|nr:hypothetical protein B0H14DRAFT_2590134 [Mycena olivaceomarginata]
MPRRKGEISIKTICFGQSANAKTSVLHIEVRLTGRDTAHNICDAQMLKMIDREDISIDADTNTESDAEEPMPELPEGLLTMAPLGEASTLASKHHPTPTSTSKSKGKKTSPVVSTSIEAPMPVRTPQLCLHSPEPIMPNSPFDGLGHLTNITANDFGQFDYNTALNKVLSRAPLALTGLAFRSGTTPPSVLPPPPSTEDVPRFIFGANPSASMPFSLSFGHLSSSTHALLATALSLPSADDQTLPAVANATLTHAELTLARPKPKPLRPTPITPASTTSITPTSLPTVVTTTPALAIPATVPAPAIPASPILATPAPMVTTVPAPSALMPVVARPAAVSVVSAVASPDPVPMAVIPMAGPQYVQSHPMANVHQGHTLAPVLPAAKKRGRPWKTAVPDFIENGTEGPGLHVVQHPKRAAKALLNADGTEIVGPVKGRRGELCSREHLSGIFDHNAAQEQADMEMEGQLHGGKRKAAKPAASKAPPRSGSMHSPWPHRPTCPTVAVIFLYYTGLTKIA